MALASAPVPVNHCPTVTGSVIRDRMTLLQEGAPFPPAALTVASNLTVVIIRRSSEFRRFVNEAELQ